ncbi:MAG: hypothetical protein DME26_10325 [Verrucomicrobia bacterium]|nr:MAG: hypothetical protein DME26_10325 [Verrucomicrobiota bacterium]
MKRNSWLILAALLSTSLLAEQATNTPAPAPIATPAAAPAVTNAAPPAPASTNAPAAKAVKKTGKKKSSKQAAVRKKDAAAELRTVPLVAGPASVIASNVNVRGKAGLKGEVIGRLTKGQPVTVLEEITLKKSGPDEPSAWAKILLPTNIHVWINSSFIEPTNKTVRPKKLNVRGGPGENFSVLGTLKRGEAIKEINTKGEWMEIEPPADGFEQEALAVLATAPVEPAPTPATVAEPPLVAPAPTETPVAPAPATTPPPANAPAATPPEAAPAVEEPLPPRIVQHEGIVRGTFSIQAPTHFELISPEDGRTINYLYSTARDLDLRRYKGLRIIVTGEEGLDERWRNTPVITIQRIQVIE